MKLRKTISIAVPFWLAFSPLAQAMPLQPGAYSWGSKYIQIAQKGDRWCYQGFVARATSIASITPDPEHSGLYQLTGMKNAVLRQDKLDQISYGSQENLLPYKADPEFGTELTAEMQQCLNSEKPYYKLIQATR